MKLDREDFRKFLYEVKKTPYLIKCTVVNGFAIHVYWNRNTELYCGTMLFNPSWGHSHGFCGDTEDKFFDEMTMEIEDAMIIFKSGGKYPENYYDNK